MWLGCSKAGIRLQAEIGGMVPACPELSWLALDVLQSASLM
jgi:hypothetical protein